MPMKNLLIIFLTVNVIIAQEKTYFQQYVEYEIDVTLDDQNHTINAYEKLLYKNNSPDKLSFIWFHIWPNAYKNDSTAFAKQAGPESRFARSDSLSRGFIDSLDFTVNGEKIDWEYHPEWIDVVKLNLNAPLNPGESIRIETPFFVKMPKVFSRLGHTGKHYEVTQWYPKPAVYDHKGWHPMPYLNQGEFYSEFGTFDVKITLPNDYRIMATGDLINGEDEYSWLDSLATVTDSINQLPEDDFNIWLKSHKKAVKMDPDSSIESEMKTLHFHQENVHDFAWFADKKWLVQKGNLSLADSSRYVTLWSFYLPKNAAMWKNSIEYLHDSGYWYSRYYGDYPYNHITAVDGDLSAGGGMEYPNITVIASMPSKQMLEMVIMHEVGHNWFYGILGSNERYHTWMDEGLNEYTCIRYWQDKYKDEDERFVIIPFIQDKLGIAKNLKFSWFEYFQYSLISQNPNKQPLSLKADEYDGANYGLNYNKTAVFTRFLQHYLSQEKMDEIMQDYYKIWKFKHPYPEDVQAIFDKHTEKDLSWYFDGVLKTTDYIDFSIKKSRGRYIVTNEAQLKTPVEVVFYGRNHLELERRWVEEFEWRKTIDPPPDTWYAIIDPDEHMPDLNRSNNATRSEVHFNWVWDQPTYYDHDINYLPWLFSFNSYNGWAPGVMLYKGGTPGYKSTTSIQPMWDAKNNQPQIKLYRIKYFNPNDLFKESSLSISGMQYQGHAGGLIKFSGDYGEDESTNRISTNINYSKLESGAFDTLLYSIGKYTTASINYSLIRQLEGGLKRSSFILGLQSGGGPDAAFTRAWVEVGLKIEISEKIGTDIRLWAGDFLNKDDLPTHFRSFISGGVDPNFTSNIIDRTGMWKNHSILNHQYIKSGPALRGLVLQDGLPMSSNEMTWGLNITPSFPLFIDIAGGSDFDQTFTAIGLKLGPLIIPLYQSWEVRNKIVKDMKWVNERTRFSFSFDLSQLINF